MAYKTKRKWIDSDTPRQLPIYKIKGKLYFRDARLGEYRNVKNPFDVIKEFRYFS